MYKTTLCKLLMGCGLCLALAGCFQTSLTGTTGATTVTVAPLRTPGTLIGEEVVTRTEGDWITALGQETWTSYPRLVQLLFLGSSAPFDTTDIDPAGLYLLTASGGEDYFSQATAIDPGEPEPVQGSWHAIVPGTRLLEGNLQISVLSEASYRQAVGRLAQLTDAQVIEQLDAAARLMVTDVDASGSVDHDDVLGWNPRLHGAKYRGDLAAVEALATAIRANQPASSLETLAKPVLGSHRVVMETNVGTLVMDTLNWETPVTVDNFLTYVEEGFYNDIIFHRVVRNFVVQAGLLTYNVDTGEFARPQPGDPIRNESQWSISNSRGTVAMARTNALDSATAQFYINQVDNTDLDFGGAFGGYTVFAELASGIDVVDTMSTSTVTIFNGLENFPINRFQISTAFIEE